MSGLEKRIRRYLVVQWAREIRKKRRHQKGPLAIYIDRVRALIAGRT